MHVSRSDFCFHIVDDTSVMNVDEGIAFMRKLNDTNDLFFEMLKKYNVQSLDVSTHSTKWIVYIVQQIDSQVNEITYQLGSRPCRQKQINGTFQNNKLPIRKYNVGMYLILSCLFF